MERQNVTLSLPKALLKKAKTLAVKKDKSLSDLLREADFWAGKNGRPAVGRTEVEQAIEAFEPLPRMIERGDVGQVVAAAPIAPRLVQHGPAA